MNDMVDSAKKEVLVEMVKLAQKRGMSGTNGSWKEFLNFHDKKFGASLSDPSRRSVESLAAFLKTFTEPEHLKFFEKVLQCHSNRDEVEQIKKQSPDNETAEQKLVRLTLEHPQYPIDYSFTSHEEGWMIVKRSKKSKDMNSTKMIAIDCEMVLCDDGTDALVKVCAVDRNMKVKLDVVVKPNKSIADYRTEITGISEKDIDGATHSLEDVQISLKKLLSHNTILIGHSLNNDLQALKVDHTRVIDTAYVFKYPNGPASKKPSLSLLCKAMLGYELRKKGSPHNCLDDACAAMKLVLAKLEGKLDDVIIEEEVKERDMTKLLVHRIPVSVLSEDLKSILPGDFTVEVKVGKKVIRDAYSAFAIFKSQQDAIKAFESLEGDLGKDTCGRPQKLVKFELDSGKAGTLYVCNSAHEDSVAAQLERRLDDVIITEEVRERVLTKLLVHRIPVSILSEDLKSILPGEFNVEVKVSKKIIKDVYSVFAIFKSQQDAIEAFENLEGELGKDTCGRPQKLVKFELDSGKAGTLYVCNSADEDSFAAQFTKKRSAEDQDAPGTLLKKHRTDKTCEQVEDSDQCNVLLKENEKLKLELSQRDQEISNLNKLIAGLVRKQGLGSLGSGDKKKKKRKFL